MSTIDEYGPYPKDESQATASVIYRHLLVATLARYRRHLGQMGPDLPQEDAREIQMQSTAALVAEWSLLLTLRLVMQQLPEQADELAVHMWDAWEDGSSFGEWLWEWCDEQGWDLERLCAALDAEIAAARESRARRKAEVSKP